jgi:hypothetical protein
MSAVIRHIKDIAEFGADAAHQRMVRRKLSIR